MFKKGMSNCEKKVNSHTHVWIAAQEYSQKEAKIENNELCLIIGKGWRIYSIRKEKNEMEVS